MKRYALILALVMALAAGFGCAKKTQDATGEGHGYGFYSEDDTVRNLVASSAADFFAANLK